MLTTNDKIAQTRYAWLSGLLFASAIAAVPIAGILLSNPMPFFRAVGFLLIPFAIFCWMFTTIRALHMRSIRYWTLASTYVNLIATLIAALIMIAFIVLTDRPQTFPGSTTFWFMSIYYGSVQLWGLWYNWSKTGSFVLALMTSILQSIGGIAIVAILLGHNKGPDEDDDD